MKKCSLIVSIAMLILPLAVFADHHEEERGALADAWIVVPKSGMDVEFAEAANKHMAFRAEAGESRSWAAFRVVVGHNLAMVQFRSCCFDYPDMDAYIAEDDELGLSANWNENVDQYVDHYHHYMDANDWENSHWPDGEGNGPYYGVTAWTWKEGAGPAPDEARKELSQVAKSEGWADAGNNWLWLEQIGGKPTLAIVTSYANFADMAPPEQSFFEFIAEKSDSPEEAGALFQQFGSGFSGSDYTVWQYDENLSTPSEEE